MITATTRLGRDSLARPSALATVAAGRFRLLGARLPTQQGAEPDEPETEPSGPGRCIDAEHDNVGPWFGRLAPCGQGFEMSRQRAPDPPLRGTGRISSRVDAGQAGHPRGERPVRLVFDNNGVVSHNPASFRILVASPVPTSFFVCTAIVMICPVFGWTSYRWLPLPVLASTNPAAFNRRISSPHVTHSV